MEPIYKNNTWELTELLKGRQAIGNRWIFKIKHDSNGNVDCFKARLACAAKGYSQRQELIMMKLLPQLRNLTRLDVF